MDKVTMQALVDTNGDTGTTLADFAPERVSQKEALRIIGWAGQLVSSGAIAVAYIDDGTGKNTRVYVPGMSAIANTKAFARVEGGA